jgi:hypothetical protein
MTINIAIWNIPSKGIPCTAPRVVRDINSVENVKVPEIKGKEFSNVQYMMCLCT